MFLAIGMSFEHEGFAGSRDVESEDPQIVSDYLEKEFGILFDQILLVKNDDITETIRYVESSDTN